MKAWVLGLKGCHLGYVIYFDSLIDGKITMHNESKLLKLDVVNKTFETEKGVYEIINNYQKFISLSD